ncbi:hypothetical protein SK128_001773, partial [Halocaridina rubra]
MCSAFATLHLVCAKQLRLPISETYSAFSPITKRGFKAVLCHNGSKYPSLPLDNYGVVLAEEDEIKSRWETYFEELLNEENPRAVFEDGLPNEALTTTVARRK